MASNDEYRVGFCTDGARDIKIRSNELFQTQGSQKKRLLLSMCATHILVVHINIAVSILQS